jgi:O-antigen/teichoic acid export membrane protein
MRAWERVDAGKVEGAKSALDSPEAGRAAVRAGLLRATSYLIVTLLGAVTAPLMFRHLGARQYGVYVTLYSLITVAGGVAELGITSIGIREWATQPASRRPLLQSQLLGIRIAAAVVGTAAACLFGVAAGYGPTRFMGIGLLGIGLLLLAYYETLCVPLQAELRQGSVAAAELVRQALQLAAVAALVAAGAGLLPFFAAAIPSSIAAIAVAAAASKQGLLRPRWADRSWLQLLVASAPFAAASAIYVLYLRATQIVTSLVTTPLQTGYFGTAFRVMEVLLGIPVLAVSAVFPLVARTASGQSKEQVGPVAALLLETAMVGGGVAAVLVFAGAELAVLVISGKFLAIPQDSLEILGAALSASFIGAAAQYQLLAIRAHREILLINGSALVLNLVLTAFLASYAGSIGSAAALACCEFFVAGAALLMLRKQLPRPLPRLALAGKVLLVVAIGGGLAQCGSLAGPLSRLAAGLIATLLALLALRPVPPPVAERLPGPLHLLGRRGPAPA